ncbi:hypothetical protein FGO68_gene7930 [Halteria grandinella]|uniref:Uncharacterized protein n=1 Tax=Halteria grandinella TaxID=5974 RepID=A0A8J8NVI7_HALGN|nr:hypothetical protein FGO68_gene7930 [Halteria grandinella]
MESTPQFLTGKLIYTPSPDEGLLTINSISLTISQPDHLLSHRPRRNHVCFIVDGSQFVSLAWLEFVRESILLGTEQIIQRDKAQQRVQTTKFYLVYMSGGKVQTSAFGNSEQCKAACQQMAYSQLMPIQPQQVRETIVNMAGNNLMVDMTFTLFSTKDYLKSQELSQEFALLNTQIKDVCIRNSSSVQLLVAIQPEFDPQESLSLKQQAKLISQCGLVQHCDPFAFILDSSPLVNAQIFTEDYLVNSVEFLNAKTLVLNIAGTSHLINVPLSNEGEAGLQWLQSNEKSHQVSSDIFNLLDSDPQNVFQFLGSWSVRMTANIQYVQTQQRKAEVSESFINPQDLASQYEDYQEEYTQGAGDALSQQLDKKLNISDAPKQKKKLDMETSKFINARAQEKPPHKLMEKSHWVKQEDTNDEEIVQNFVARVKGPLLNPKHSGQIGAKFSGVGEGMGKRIGAMVQQFIEQIKPIADQRGFDIVEDKKYSGIHPKAGEGETKNITIILKIVKFVKKEEKEMTSQSSSSSKKQQAPAPPQKVVAPIQLCQQDLYLIGQGTHALNDFVAQGFWSILEPPTHANNYTAKIMYNQSGQTGSFELKAQKVLWNSAMQPVYQQPKPYIGMPQVYPQQQVQDAPQLPVPYQAQGAGVAPEEKPASKKHHPKKREAPKDGSFKPKPGDFKIDTTKEPNKVYGHLMYMMKNKKNTRLIVLDSALIPMVEKVIRDFQKKNPAEVPAIPDGEQTQINEVLATVYKLNFK